MATKIFNLSLPAELVRIIDEQAKRHYATRSEYIKTTLLARLKQDGALDGLGVTMPQTFDEIQRQKLKEFLKNQEFEDDEFEEK